MKAFYSLCAIVLCATSANAAELNCQGKFMDGGGTDVVIQLQGNYQDNVIQNITAKATSSFYNDEMIGYSASLTSSDNSKARKYKDFYKFELKNLEETTGLGSFLPNDSCKINLFIPLNTEAPASFKAPAVVSCDQSGTSMTLKCDLGK